MGVASTPATDNRCSSHGCVGGQLAVVELARRELHDRWLHSVTHGQPPRDFGTQVARPARRGCGRTRRPGSRLTTVAAAGRWSPASTTRSQRSKGSSCRARCSDRPRRSPRGRSGARRGSRVEARRRGAQDARVWRGCLSRPGSPTCARRKQALASRLASARAPAPASRACGGRPSRNSL